MRFRNIVLFSNAILALKANEDDPICRNKRSLFGHHKELWLTGYPTTNEYTVPLCGGDMVMDEFGDICINGRVSYKQLNDFVKGETGGKKSVFGPAASTVSIQGHLVSGAANAVRGNQATYVYDFIKNYTIGGVTYLKDNNMLERMLAASYGTIDNLCLDSSFAGEEYYYSVTHLRFPSKNIDTDAIKDLNLAMGTKAQIVAEFHTIADEPSMIWKLLSQARFALYTALTSFPTPLILYRFLPLLRITGNARWIILGGLGFAPSTLSVLDYPQPLEGPDVPVENIEIDTDWSAFLTVLGNGILAEAPEYMGFIIKRIEPNESTVGCWNSTVGTIDMQMSAGYEGQLDAFANDILYPALIEAGGTVSMHLGKRIPVDSPATASAMTFYGENCGVQRNIEAENCYHPMCTRANNPVSSFTYPEKYYGKRESSFFDWFGF